MNLLIRQNDNPKRPHNKPKFSLKILFIVYHQISAVQHSLKMCKKSFYYSFGKEEMEL